MADFPKGQGGKFEPVRGGVALGLERIGLDQILEGAGGSEAVGSAAMRGHVHPDFESVARQLARVVSRDPRGGAALTLYHQGECVLDLQAGVRDSAGRPWAADTLSLCYSTGKGVLATLLHVLVDQGALAYSDRVARHWPRFAQGGKGEITVRQLLCHEAGLYRITDWIESAEQMLDWERMIAALEGAEPAHRPGRAHGYHGLSFGWLVGELLQRATGTPLDRLLRTHLADPLGLDEFFFGLPEEADERRAEWVYGEMNATTSAASRMARRFGFERAAASGGEEESAQWKAVFWPKGMERLDLNSVALRRAVIPAFNGMFSARGLARLYAALVEGGAFGGTRLLSSETLKEATRVQNHGVGRVLPQAMNWRLGYHGLPSSRAEDDTAFGHFGIGGSGALADPDRELALAFAVNTGLTGSILDSRMVRIVRAAFRAAEARSNRGVGLGFCETPASESVA